MEFGINPQSSESGGSSSQNTTAHHNLRGGTARLGGITVDTAVGENAHTFTPEAVSTRRTGSGKGRSVVGGRNSKEHHSLLEDKERYPQHNNRPTAVVLTSDDDEQSPSNTTAAGGGGRRGGGGKGPLPIREVSADSVPSTGGSPVYGSTQPFMTNSSSSSPLRPHSPLSNISENHTKHNNPDADPNLTRAETTLEKALDGAASKLHRRMNVLYIAIIGFIVIGLCALACVTFGVVEIAMHDSVFSNVGLGEVLTVLGIYFTIPYLFILLAFFVATHNVHWMKSVGSLIRPRAHFLFLTAIIALYLLQQCFTDVYLVVLNSEWFLFVIIGDIAVFVALIYFHNRPFGHMLHIGLFAVKLGMQWGNAYQAITQPVFGPNGVSVMLFLCIPLVQMPLQSSFLKPIEETETDNEDQARRLLSPRSSPSAAGDVYSERGSMNKEGGNNSGSPLYSPGGASNNDHRNHTSYTPIGASPGGGSAHSRKSNDTLHARSRPTSNHIISGGGERDISTPDTLSTFVTNFNLYLSHLMHSLDIMSLYFFSFTSPETDADHIAAPTPFRNFIAMLSIFAFLVNNLVVLHLFFHRPGILDVVIPGLPNVITSLAEKGSGVSRGVAGGGPSLATANQGFLVPSSALANKKGGARGSQAATSNAAEAHKAAHRVKMLQYMIIMLIVVDIPFVIARLELWRKEYSALSIFVAKNIKDIVDMTMLLSRNKEVDEEGGGGDGGGGGGGTTTPASGRGGDEYNRLSQDERKLRGISVVRPQHANNRE